MKKIITLALLCLLLLSTKAVISKAEIAGERYPEPMVPTALFLI